MGKVEKVKRISYQTVNKVGGHV